MTEDTLERRLAALEADVRELKRRTGGAGRESVSPTPTPGAPAVQGRARDEDRVPDSKPIGMSGIIAKLGIALLLVGIALLLKYGYDEGWLSESVRVMLGLVAGASLLVGGMRVRDENTTLSAVLLGGSVATFYASVFAAYQLYDLVPWSVAFAGMVGTTMLGFVLSVTQDRRVLALVAAFGALATPFLLHTPTGTPQMLSLYTVVVLMGTTSIYLMRGWSSLHLTAGIGGLIVVATAAFGLPAEPGSVAQFLVFVGIVVSVVAAALAPVLRRKLSGGELSISDHALALFAPMAAVVMFEPVSGESTTILVVCVAALGALFATVHAMVDDEEGTFLGAAAALFTCAAGVALSAEPVIIALLSLAVSASVVGARVRSIGIRGVGYVALGLAGISIVTMLMIGDPTGMPFLNAGGLQMVLGTIALLLVGLTVDEQTLRWTHIYAAAGAGLVTVVHQLADVAGGAGIATGVWGALALGILVAGLLRDHLKLEMLGLGIVLLTAGKLLIFDLESVATIWRMVLFLLLGSALLYISHLLPRWQRTVRTASE